ncbi:MAG: c-type cytochrome domain-containing protein [Sandaracinus sp.]
MLGPRCVVMTACHSFEEHQGGVILATPEEAASTLAPHVIAGDARCSDLGFRVTTDAPLLRMPPASGLSTAERCAVLAWIEAGAEGL